MPIIKVDPDSLSKISKKMTLNAVRVSAAGNFIKLSGALARTYAKNSFGPQVRAICSEGSSRGANLGNSLYNSGGILSLIALNFAAVDNKLLRGFIKKISSLFIKAEDRRSPFGELLEKAEKERNSKEPIDETGGKINQHQDEKIPQDLSGVKTASFNNNAPIYDCVAFVKGQRSVPSNIYNYSDPKSIPQPGAIMIEEGHASYVYEVTYDSEGFPASYKIAEGNWDHDLDGVVDSINYETFKWDPVKNVYLTDRGKRPPKYFIY